MDVAMARMIVAKRKRLRIVGAERNGPTAISHRHGKLWIFNKHGCSACFLRRKQAGQKIARLASSIIMYQRYNRQLPDLS